MSEMLGKEMMAQSKFFMGYSRWIDEAERFETWEEAVERVMNMHREKYKDIMTPEIEGYIKFAEELYKQKRVVGSQRSLQFGGPQIFKHNAKLYNWSYSHVDRAEFFQECMYLLLCGCGTGLSVQKHHVAKLPKIKKRYEKKSKIHVIDDSIEGWADAFGVLMSSFFEEDAPFPEYKGCHVAFDFSKIRPKGAEISGGFKAPGPDGFRRSLQLCEELLERETENTKEPVSIRPIVAYDIVMHMSDAVLSGGVRRCLPKGSKVFMKNGVKNIEDVKVGEQVLTPYGYRQVKNHFIQGNQQLIQINTQDGLFKCTPNHKMPVLNSMNNYKWVRADELKEGDILITNTTPIGGQKTSLPAYTYHKPESSSTCVDITIPELDENMAWFIGLFHGDGYVLNNGTRDKKNNTSSSYLSLVFPLEQYDMALKAEDQLRRFGTRTILKKCKNENSYILKTTSRQLAQYFYNNIKKPNTNIEIPDFIWNASTDIKKSYVSGLMDADGSVGKPVQICTTVYKQYALDIQTLLYSCGITSRFKKASYNEEMREKQWKPKYTVSLINNKDKNVFKNTNTLHKVFNESKVSQKGNSFPSSFTKKEETFKGQQSKMGLFTNKNTTVDCVERYGYDVKLMPVKVVSVETIGFEDTFDIEVDDVHQFYCNGYLTHNSATICLFSKDDEEMLNAKTGDWFVTNPQRGRSNNSAVLVRDEVTREEFANIMNSVKQFGEPGFVFTESTEHGFNPCVEIGLVGTTEDGRSGFQFCNLSSINGALCESEEQFIENCRAAAILGTLQAGFTDFRYVSQATRDLTEREALIGVSITGWMNNPDLLFQEEVMKKGAEEVKRVNKELAKMLGINQAARTTCTKPEGNTSVLLGCASGIHGEHSPLYFRNVQMNDQDDTLNIIKTKNPKMVEKSVWSNTGTDYCVSFPVVSDEGSVYKDQLLGVKQLEYVKKAQQVWVENGTNTEQCIDPNLRHNISNTITVDNWDEVEEYIYQNRQWFAGISLLSAFGDKAYAQAPFTEVLTSEQILKKYGESSLFASGLIVDGLHAFENNLWTACDTLLGFGITLDEESSEHLLKRDWVRRAKKFAKNYFLDGISIDNVSSLKEDIEEVRQRKAIENMISCLKDCYNLHKWNSIVRSMEDIDFSKELGKKSFVEVDTMGASACSGGKCELDW